MVAGIGPVPAPEEKSQVLQNIAIKELFRAVNFLPPLIIGGYASSVNLNSANTDTAITISSVATNYYLHSVIVRNNGTTASLTAATAGLFTATAAGGTTLAPNQALSSITSNAANTARGLAMLTLSTGGMWLNSGTVYFRVGTAQGAAATADVYVCIQPLP